MTVDLTALDAAYKTLQAAPGANPAVKAWATQVQTVVHAMNTVTPVGPPTPAPTPAGVIAGIGTEVLGDSLPSATHLDSYGVVVVNWADAAQVAHLPGMVFAYENLGPPGFAPLNLGAPDVFLASVAALPSGVNVYLDNCSVEQASTQLPFLRAVAPTILATRKLMLNANGYGGTGDSNNGESDRLWFAQLAGLASHLQSEFWMQGRGGPREYALRLRGSATYTDFWDEWQQLPKAAHDAGCHFVGYTYGAGVGESNAVYGRASLLTAPDFQSGDVFLYAAGTAEAGGPDAWGSSWTTGTPHPTVDPVAGSATL